MKKLLGIQLAQLGFVHVTGLVMNDDESRKIQAFQVRELGHYDYNNGKVVAYTLNGEVWLASSEVLSKEGIDAALAELCPSGRGAFVPCSNGESVEWSQMLARVADPCWEGYPGHRFAQFDHLLVEQPAPVS